MFGVDRRLEHCSVIPTVLSSAGIRYSGHMALTQVPHPGLTVSVAVPKREDVRWMLDPAFAAKPGPGRRWSRTTGFSPVLFAKKGTPGEIHRYEARHYVHGREETLRSYVYTDLDVGNRRYGATAFEAVESRQQLEKVESFDSGTRSIEPKTWWCAAI